MEQPANNHAVTELHVSDFNKVKDFYGKLGFQVVWEREPEAMKGYLAMEMQGNILCFWPGNKESYNHPYFKQFPKETKRGYGVEIVIMVENVENLYKKAKAFANVIEELTTQPWGIKDFRIEDPFGYYLRITGVYNTLSDDYAVA